MGITSFSITARAGNYIREHIKSPLAVLIPEVESSVISKPEREVIVMLSWALVFLAVAIIAAVLGFTGIAGAAAGIAKILFVIFLVIFIVSIIFGRRAV